MSADTAELDFLIIDTALERLDADIDAAEYHGILCGLLCSSPEPEKTTWREKILPAAQEGDVLAQESLKILDALYLSTLQELNNSDFDFHLLLPDDDDPLSLRSQSLGSWCHGFLMGLSIGGVTDYDSLPEECTELVHDFLQISNIDEDQLDESEDNEVSFAELVEYVRMGTLLINEELMSGTSSTAGRTLH